MRSAKLTAFLFFIVSHSMAQDFQGFRASNYTGVNGVYFNPAAIADSRYRFDVNLFSISTSVGNNQASYNLGALTKSFNAEELEQKVFGSNAGLSSGLVNVDVHGPAIMFNTSKKSAVALTTRLRTTTNIMDIDGRLASQLMNEEDAAMQFPYTMSSNANMRLAVNAWTEVGASYARVIKEGGDHFLKGGITLKYLGGAANAYLQVDNFKSTLNKDELEDTYLANTTGRIAMGFGGIDIADMETKDMTQMESTGFGGDLGLVYEFRPQHEAHKHKQTGNWLRDQNKYKLKVGVSLLDIGTIRYERDIEKSGAYDLNITGNERFYLADIADTEVDDYNTYFQSKPEYFTPADAKAQSSYKVSLPATLQLDVDYHLHGGFYTQLAAQLPVASRAVYNSRYYSSFTLTPRYEGRALGLYVPISYNSLTHFNAGVSVRIGPVFVGSGSILTAAMGNAKQADVHVGIHVGGLHKNLLKKERRQERKRAAKATEPSI